MNRIFPFAVMLAVLLLMCGCENGRHGDNIGDFNDTVSVSFKETDAPESLSITDVDSMIPVFASIISVIEYTESAYRAGDDTFIVQVLSTLALKNGVTNPDKALLNQYAAVCFDGMSEAPEADYSSANAVSDTGLSVITSDFLSGEDGTFTAYIDCVNSDGIIINVYIFTLVESENGQYSYSVRSAVVMR